MTMPKLLSKSLRVVLIRLGDLHLEGGVRMPGIVDVGRRRNRDDALAGLSGGWDAYRSNSLRRRLGFGEGSCIRSSQDRLEERQGTGRRNESTS
jgi:hypothetical protein